MSKVVRFEVPKEVKDKKFEQEYLTAAQEVVKEQTILRLFEEGRVSTGYAAKILGLPRYQFVDLLAKHRVPLFNYSQEELDQEFPGRDRPVQKPQSGGREESMIIVSDAAPQIALARIGSRFSQVRLRNHHHSPNRL